MPSTPSGRGKHGHETSGFVPVQTPPSDFDPLEASTSDLVAYAYPRRPPPTNTEALEIWRAIVSGSLPTEQQVDGGEVNAGDYRTSFNVPIASGRDETSQNWSGLVTHSNGNPFVSVFGMWQVPAVSAPAGTSRGDFRCSTWIGLDGTKRSLPSLPQIGTTQRVHVKRGVATPEFQAWSQWWAPGAITKIRPFPTFPVDAGDIVACSIDVIAGTNVNVAITNVTKGTPPYRRSMVPIIITLPGGATIELNTAVTGTTAEWIAERPRRYRPPMNLYPLPVFDRVTFSAATVSVADGGQRGLGPVKVIRMVEPDAGPPARLRVLSRARKDYLADGGEIAVAGPGLEHQIGG